MTKVDEVQSIEVRHYGETFEIWRDPRGYLCVKKIGGGYFRQTDNDPPWILALFEALLCARDQIAGAVDKALLDAEHAVNGKAYGDAVLTVRAIRESVRRKR